jgi:hypothetical protein
VVQLVKVPNKARDWDRSLTPHVGSTRVAQARADRFSSSTFPYRLDNSIVLRSRSSMIPSTPPVSVDIYHTQWTKQKACAAFEKLSSLRPANKWLSVYAPKIRERLNETLGNVGLVDQDILAMQMVSSRIYPRLALIRVMFANVITTSHTPPSPPSPVASPTTSSSLYPLLTLLHMSSGDPPSPHQLCGYETIAQGSSHFCNLFTPSEWYDFEYYMDIRFYHMMGPGNDLSAYLGMPWVKTAKHLLGGKDTRGHVVHGEEEEVWNGQGFAKLPKPELPPNATHTQL